MFSNFISKVVKASGSKRRKVSKKSKVVNDNVDVVEGNNAAVVEIKSEKATKDRKRRKHQANVSDVSFV